MIMNKDTEYIKFAIELAKKAVFLMGQLLMIMKLLRVQ